MMRSRPHRRLRVSRRHRLHCAMSETSSHPQPRDLARHLSKTSIQGAECLSHLHHPGLQQDLLNFQQSALAEEAMLNMAFALCLQSTILKIPTLGKTTSRKQKSNSQRTKTFRKQVILDHRQSHAVSWNRPHVSSNHRRTSPKTTCSRRSRR